MEQIYSTKWKLKEITLVAVVSIALGVVWWGWTVIYNFFDPILRPFGLNYLVVGFWFIGGTLLPYIIRKPGAAFFAESLAALVEGFVTQWGITALFWGMVQGAFSEGVFASFRYKKYSLPVMMLSGAAAGVGSYILDYFYSKYSSLGINIILVQIAASIVSGIILGGLLAKSIGDGLNKTGVLNQFAIAYEEENTDGK